MNDKFENQKERLLAIKQEISLLYQQVNYLLRNEKPLELLDLDVLMNRTHTLYDQLCAINLGEDVDDEDLPFDADDLVGLFGGTTQDEPVQPAEEENTVAEEQPVAEAPAVEAPVVETPQPEPVVENPEANILIIAGCFDQEEYAIRLTNTLKEKGYMGAFYELRNNKWFVSFGRYATDEEALTVLREIRAKNEYKAWILSL